MDRLAVVGVSHMRGGAEALEHWQQNFSSEVIKEKNLTEYVSIATCNRWDLTMVLPEEASLASICKEFQPTGSSFEPYTYTGNAALRHITRVASSLDSLNPGEDQIMNQVRQAYRDAKDSGTLGNTTAFAFETAMRIAKKVRREVGISPMETSLFSLACPMLRETLDAGATIAVLGAGKMGALAVKSLSDFGYNVVVVNRSIERAEELAKPFDFPVMQLDEFMAEPLTIQPTIQAMVCATPVKDLIQVDFVKQFADLRVIVDLGIPRNVEMSVANELQLLNVDTLQVAGQARRNELKDKLEQADIVIQQELEEALALWSEKLIGPSIRQMREDYRKTLLEVLPESEVNKVLGRLLHGPIKGIRAVAREHGYEAAMLYFDEIKHLK